MKRIFLIEGNFCLNYLLLNHKIPEDSIQKIEYYLGLGPGKRNENIYYVGLIEIDNFQIFCLPKYCNMHEKNHASIIIELLIRISSNRNIQDIIPDSYLLDQKNERKPNRKIELAFFLLNDFFENGLINIKEKKDRISKQGNPIWIKTINKIEPIWSNNTPIYDRWFSSYSNNSTNNFLSKIHAHIINECHFLYGYLLGYPEPNLESSQLKFYNKRKIISYIYSILPRIYSIRQVEILKKIIIWLQEEPILSTKPNFLGTSYFSHIWELCCSYLLVDVKDSKKWEDIMPYPEWIQFPSNEKYKAQGRFLLDSLTEIPEGKRILITDAKYYVPKFINNKALGVPGMDSLSKQVHYEKLIKKNLLNENSILNAFVFPESTNKSNTWRVSGSVKVAGMMRNPIICLNFNPTEIFKRYLQHKPFNEKELQDIANKIQLYQSYSL